MVDQARPETAEEVDRNLIATEFAERMAGKLDQEKIDQAVGSIQSAADVHSADLELASFIFYQRVKVVDNVTRKIFTGNAGGVAFPGSISGWGGLYATDDDFDRLYRDTVSFELNLALAYTSVLFFDGSSNLLGHFEGGAIAITAGIGGGTGTWE